MMLRNLLNEMMRRRLLPVAAIAVLVAVVAPLLFLKGAPDGAPSADSAAPAAATEAKLPARAARLLASTDAGAAGGGARGASHDPFGPASPATTAAAAGGGAAKVSTPTGSVTSSTQTAVPAVTSNPTPSTPSSHSSPSRKSTATATPRSYSVDIRFGAKSESKIRRAIPRYKAFYIHGKVIAVFVKYSPSRKAAVFAVAPGMHISGPVKCRVQDGVCKYLDIPAGSYARIAMVTTSKMVVSRRLDVVRAKRGISAATKATAASTRGEAACLMGKLLAMKPGDALIDRDACER